MAALSVAQSVVQWAMAMLPARRLCQAHLIANVDRACRKMICDS
jgi:hypothetical protein